MVAPPKAYSICPYAVQTMIGSRYWGEQTAHVTPNTGGFTYRNIDKNVLTHLNARQNIESVSPPEKFIHCIHTVSGKAHPKGQNMTGFPPPTKMSGPFVSHEIS